MCRIEAFIRSPLRKWNGCGEEVEAETDPAFVFNVIDILFELLAVEKRAGTFRGSGQYLEQDRGCPYYPWRVSESEQPVETGLHDDPRTHELKDWQIETLSKLIVEAGEEQRIERIGRILEKEETVRLEDVNELPRPLPAVTAINPLIKLLGRTKEIEDPKR